MVTNLVFASSFTKFAGPNTPLLDLCNYLHERLDVDLAVVTHNGEFEKEFLRSIRFPVLPVLMGQSPDPPQRLLSAPVNVGIIRRTIGSSGVRQEGVFVNASIDTLFEARWATRRKVPTGYNVLFNRVGSFLFKLMDRVAAKHAVQKIVAHTQFQKSLYLTLGIPEEAVTVIPHCIDLNRIRRSVIRADRVEGIVSGRSPVILYGGRLAPEKGLKELLDCYEHLCKVLSAGLILVGNGPLRHWILQRKSEIEANCEDAEITVLPRLPPQEFLSIMNASSVVVVPSRLELFGLVILEAMCLNKPVISTYAGGPAEIITDHVDGLLIRPNDACALEMALKEVLGDSKLGRRMGSKALEKIRTRFEVSRVAPQFLEFMGGE